MENHSPYKSPKATLASDLLSQATNGPGFNPMFSKANLSAEQSRILEAELVNHYRLWAATWIIPKLRIHELMAQCWNYAHASFANQAQRLAFAKGIQPRFTKEVIAQLHGFSSWAGLSRTMSDLHDIALSCYLELDESENAKAYRRNTLAQLKRLVAIEDNLDMGSLEQILRPDYPLDRLNDEGEEEYIGWDLYQQVKTEIAYRTVWIPGNFGFSSYSQEIAVDLAEAFLTKFHGDGFANSPREALEAVMSFFHGNTYALSSPGEGAVADFLEVEPMKKATPIAECLGIERGDELKWVRASTLMRDLAYVDLEALDGHLDEFPVFALLPHAPRDTHVQVHVDFEGEAALWSDVIVPDKSCLTQLGMIAPGIPYNAETISLTDARDELKDETKAGWLIVKWD